MASAPLVTIGIPTHNSARFIGEAISSALAQSYEPLEIIVVDDASTDETVAIARRFEDTRISVIVNDENLGLAGNHNKVLELASGEFVKILHGDDSLAPDCIERQARPLAEGPGVALVTSRRTIIDDEGKRLMSRGPDWSEGRRPGADVVREVVRQGRNLLGEPSAVLFRRDEALAVGGFSAEWPYAVDLEFYARLLRRGDLYYIPEPLASFRVSTGQTSARVASVQASDAIRLLDHIRHEYGLGITEQEVRRGSRIARRDASLRRLLYGVLAVPARHRERIAYLIGGSWNTLFAYAVFSLLWWLFSDVAPYWLLLLLAQVASAANGFYVQRRFVFRSEGDAGAQLPRFLAVYAAIFVINVAVFPVLVNIVSLNPYVSQALFTVFVVVVGYIANKYFTFREPAVGS